MTQIYIKQNIHKRRIQNFRRISPFGITPFEKAHKAKTRWYRGPFRRSINRENGERKSTRDRREVFDVSARQDDTRRVHEVCAIQVRGCMQCGTF